MTLNLTELGPVLIAGSSHPALAALVASHLGLDLAPVHREVFSSGEVYVSLEESVRNRDVFIIQAHTPPVNDHLMESLLLVDAARRASAASVTLVVPFFPYARQDRKGSHREPISAQVVSNLYSSVGVERVMTLDLHAPQIQGFFPGAFDHLSALGVLSSYVKDKYQGQDLTVVSPDAGRVKSAERWTDQLGAPLAIIHKRRDAGQVRTFEVVGEVRDKTCVIIDDMIDTAGTVISAASTLKEKGAREVLVAATHGVLSGPALMRLGASPFDEVILTDTIPNAQAAANELAKITVLSVAPLLASAIKAVSTGVSLSNLTRGLL